MRKALVLLLIATAAVAQAHPAIKQIHDADTKAWWHTTEALSGDDMEGRDTGSAAYQRAADYVAARYKAAGLKPAGDNGTYFQQVPMHEIAVDNGHIYTCSAHDGSSAIPIDFLETDHPYARRQPARQRVQARASPFAVTAARTRWPTSWARSSSASEPSARDFPAVPSALPTRTPVTRSASSPSTTRASPSSRHAGPPPTPAPSRSAPRPTSRAPKPTTNTALQPAHQRRAAPRPLLQGTKQDAEAILKAGGSKGSRCRASRFPRSFPFNCTLKMRPPTLRPTSSRRCPAPPSLDQTLRRLARTLTATATARPLRATTSTTARSTMPLTSRC